MPERKFIIKEMLRPERDKVANILYRGLTEAKNRKREKLELDYAREQGLEQGIEQGRDEIVRMNDYLISQNRLDDLKLATKDDESFRQKILAEMAAHA